MSMHPSYQSVSEKDPMQYQKVNIFDEGEGYDRLHVEHNKIYWSLLFLNMVVLWAYQSLVAAQHYYLITFPNANIDFWGIVFCGGSMVFFHILLTTSGFNDRVHFSYRILPAYVGFILVALIVIFSKNVSVILGAWFLVGMLNTISESPLYGIAGMFPTGAFTQAVNAGNGLAGFLNVTIDVIIRLSVYTFAPEISFYIFLSLLIFLCLCAMAVYTWMINLASYKFYIKKGSEQKHSHSGSPNRIDRRSSESAYDLSVNKKLPYSSSQSQLDCEKQTTSLYLLLQEIWEPALSQFLTLFVSLFLWPGIPCNSRLYGFFLKNQAWFCSPFIIAAFNYGDVIGRFSALRISLSIRTCLYLAFARLFYIPLVFFCVWSGTIKSNWIIIIIVFSIGISNGILCTITMMKGPLIAHPKNQEKAAYIMVTLLYTGIATGSITAALFNNYAL